MAMIPILLLMSDAWTVHSIISRTLPLDPKVLCMEEGKARDSVPVSHIVCQGKLLHATPAALVRTLEQEVRRTMKCWPIKTKVSMKSAVLPLTQLDPVKWLQFEMNVQYPLP